MLRLRPLVRPLTITVAVLGLGGCSATYDKNFFDYDREQSRTRKVFEMQYAQAATEEASLRATHFADADDGSGPRLSSLGRERLDYIAHSRKPGEVTVVYVDTDADPMTDVPLMIAAAEDYVGSLRLPAGAIKVVAGPTTASSPAKPIMADRDRMEGPSSESLGSPGTAGLSGIFGASK
ncbi:MAG: hypothetical protein AAGI46_07205 [Planctomycetota bacterium]